MPRTAILAATLILISSPPGQAENQSADCSAFVVESGNGIASHAYIPKVQIRENGELRDAQTLDLENIRCNLKRRQSGPQCEATPLGLYQGYAIVQLNADYPYVMRKFVAGSVIAIPVLGKSRQPEALFLPTENVTLTGVDASGDTLQIHILKSGKPETQSFRPREDNYWIRG